MSQIPEPHDSIISSDAEMVEACQKGNLDAFEWLVEKYQNPAFAIALSYVSNFHDAQEIVQEAFLKAYCKLIQLINPSQFGSWFCTIVSNLCRSWLRRRLDIFSLLDASVQTTISDLSVQQRRQDDIRTFVWDMIESLPEKYRVVVLLYYMNDYSYNELADFLDLPVTTVKGRLQQARLKLKREFGLEEREELKMTQTNNEFSKKVIHAVCQIAIEPIKETISFMGTDHVVLYFGIDADIEVRQHEKETVEITGTKYSLGGEEEDAQKSISGIQFDKGIAENYWEEGPHQMEVFTGTGRDEDGNPVANFASSNHLWGWTQNMLEEQGDASSILQTALRRAIRVTVGRQKGEDITLSRKAYTNEIQRIFDPNWTTDELLHGSAGYLSLVILLPPNKNLTII